MKQFTEILKQLNETLDISSDKEHVNIDETVLLSDDLSEELLLEELHDQIKRVVDNSSGKGRSTVLSAIAKTAQKLHVSGVDPGLSDKPLGKGSSRGVWSVTHPRNVEIDGKQTSMPTVLKVAFKSPLDEHHSSDMTLGQHQNEAENDGIAQSHHSILKPIGDGRYETNPRGVLPPIFDSHPDSHWIESAKARKFSSSEFKEITKTKDHPKGLDFKKVAEHLNNEYNRSQGRNVHTNLSEDEEDHLESHPFVEGMKDAMFNLGLHPGDFASRNMGIIDHPVTGTKHPVLLDSGFNDHTTAKLYNEARKNKMMKNRR